MTPEIKVRKKANRVAYSKSSIDTAYHYKHIGAWIGTWALVMYDRLSLGFPSGAQEWTLFVLINIAYVFGATQSLQGAKKIAG